MKNRLLLNSDNAKIMRKITEKQVVEIRINRSPSKKELLEAIENELKNLPETAVIRGFHAMGIVILGSRWEYEINNAILNIFP